MNAGLAQANIRAVTDKRLDADNPNYPTDPGVERKGMCSRFTRCATRLEYGQKYQGLFGGSAKATGENFKDAGFTISSLSRVEAGDILIKMSGSGGFGHIGTFVGSVPGLPYHDYVAENSSISVGRVPGQGAKGYRRRGQYGHFDLIGRLPAKEKEESVYRLFLNDRQVAVMPIVGGRSYCKVETWTEALGLESGWDEETRNVLIDGRPLPKEAELFLREGRSFVWIRDLVEFSGLQLEVKDDIRKAIVTRPQK